MERFCVVCDGLLPCKCFGIAGGTGSSGTVARISLRRDLFCKDQLDHLLLSCFSLFEEKIIKLRFSRRLKTTFDDF
jgi:hypothetical protein